MRRNQGPASTGIRRQSTAEVDTGWLVGTTAAALSVPAGAAEMSGMTRIGSNGKLYFATPKGNVFHGNQYVTTTSLSQIGRLTVRATVGTSLVVDVYNLDRGRISKGKFAANAAVLGASALVGGPFGLSLSATYFGGDAIMRIRNENRSVMDEWCKANGC